MNTNKTHQIISRVLMLLLYIFMMFAYPLNRLALLIETLKHDTIVWAFMPWWGVLFAIIDTIAAFMALIMFGMAFKITCKELIKCFRS